MISNKKLIEKANNAKNLRSQWESNWQEVNDYILPRKNDILSKRTPGEKKGNLLFDSTGPQSCEMLAGHLHGVLTNPAIQFFELLTGDDAIDQMDDVRFWYQDTTQKLHNILSRSNFHTEIHEFDLDLCSIGTSVLQIEEDDEFIARFSCRPIQEVCVAEDSRGIINEIYRRFSWTADKICEAFGDENVTDKILKAKKKGLLEEFEVLHVILPRDYNDRKNKKGAKSYEYESRYVLIAEEHTLEEEGFQELPIVVSRWSKTAGEVYGRSPGMTALPDVKMANRMMETTIMGAQLTIAPPFMLPDDGVRLPLKLKPYGMTFYRSGLTESRVEPLFPVPPRIDFGFQLIEMISKRIRDAFFVDQLLSNKKAEMTATEVIQRNEENIRLLGPMYGRQEFETLRPLVSRVLNIAMRNMKKSGLLVPPQILQGRVIDVKYSSLIAKAQRSSEVQNLLRGLQTLAPVAQIDPSTWDNFNADKIALFVSTNLGLPQKIMNDKKEIKDIREARAEANKKMVDQQNLAQQADAINKVAPHALKAQEQG